jgi:magnesium-transporting ATPase (P-type)
MNSSLTGESEPVSKMSDVVPGDSVSVSDQSNMVFKGTNVVSGNGERLLW